MQQTLLIQQHNDHIACIVSNDWEAFVSLIYLVPLPGHQFLPRLCMQIDWQNLTDDRRRYHNRDCTYSSS